MGARFNQLMGEEEQLIKDRNFYLSMMDECDRIIKHGEKAGYQPIVDKFKKEKEDYHQQYRDANNRLKVIQNEMYELT